MFSSNKTFVEKLNITVSWAHRRTMHSGGQNKEYFIIPNASERRRRTEREKKKKVMMEKGASV